MTRPLRPLRRLLPLGLLLGAIGCSGGLNCGNGCANTYGYQDTLLPNGTASVDDGVRARLTQAGLDFLRENLETILLSQFPTSPGTRTLAIELPPTVLNANVSIGQGPEEIYPTSILIDIDEFASRLTLAFDDASNGIRLGVTNLPIGIDARVFGQADLGLTTANAACGIVGTACPANNPNCGIVSNVSLTMLVLPRIGNGAQCDEAGGVGECLKVDVELETFDLGDIGSGSLEIVLPPSDGDNCDAPAPANCSPTCSDPFPLFDANDECVILCGAADFLSDVLLTITGFLENALGDLLAPVVEQAIQGALEDVDGAPLSIASRQDLAAAAPGVLPASALDLGFKVAPTVPAFDVNTPSGGALGMDLVLKTGFQAAPSEDESDGLGMPHPCVRPIAGVPFSDLYGAFEFAVPDDAIEPLTGNFEGEPYHLAASLAKPAVNQILFGLYNTGALCLEIDSDAVNRLAGDAFQLSAATLDLFTGGKLKQYAEADAPAIVTVNPSQPPVVRYGAGTTEEGHLIIDWPNVEVGFYVMMFNRFSRVFAVSADISLQIAVFEDPETRTLKISIVDGPNITDFQETFNDLLAGVNFTEVLEQLLGVVFDAALGDGLEFSFDVGNALSGALGVPIFIDFRGLETVPAGNDRQFLNVYLAMTNTPPQPRTYAPSFVSLAREPGVLRTVDLDDVAVARGLRVLPSGQVRLDVTEGDDREFFARVDFGAWRGPLRSEGGVLVVKDGKLRAVGEHTITVKSRLRGLPGSLEREGTAVTVWVDGQAPAAKLARRGDALVATGTDDGTAARGLVWSWQLDDGAWSDFGTTSSLPLAGLNARRVAVKAQDLAGNVSRAVGLDVSVEQRRLRADREAASTQALGCAETSAPDAAWCAGLLAALGLARRRHRRR